MDADGRLQKCFCDFHMTFEYNTTIFIYLTSCYEYPHSRLSLLAHTSFYGYQSFLAFCAFMVISIRVQHPPCCAARGPQLFLCK